MRIDQGQPVLPLSGGDDLMADGIILGVAGLAAQESPLCIAGEILRGLKKPHQCPAFGTLCTPERPLGAPMVSSEGACAAYYRYRRVPASKPEPERRGSRSVGTGNLPVSAGYQPADPTAEPHG